MLVLKYKIYNVITPFTSSYFLMISSASFCGCV